MIAKTRSSALRSFVVLGLLILAAPVLDAFTSSIQAPAPAPQAKPERAEAARFDVARAVSRIKVDGVLDEEPWGSAAVIPLLYEWTPGDNTPAPVKTECLVTYDVHNLYVGFRCFDPEPRKIRAHLMDRDDTDRLILDDHISIMVDSFNDERRGFQFRVNPLGVQADANFSESEGYEDFSWDAIWSSAGKISDWGYAVEMAIPLDQLRFKRTDGPQTWGLSAERSWPRGARYRITSHIRSRNVGCIICQFNK
ncbi:MAG: carbohydrate binding family 9 domain-containing protein, partial [Candidatus Aminicenantes bacterium]|nr:carbohydrate binding family 9 domain-containing protein [Candidatus Aminicenantes bacterium]